MLTPSNQSVNVRLFYKDEKIRSNGSQFFSRRTHNSENKRSPNSPFTLKRNPALCRSLAPLSPGLSRKKTPKGSSPLPAPSIISALVFPRIAQFFRGKRRCAKEQKPRAECAKRERKRERTNGPLERPRLKGASGTARGLKRSERERLEYYGFARSL